MHNQLQNFPLSTKPLAMWLICSVVRYWIYSYSLPCGHVTVSSNTPPLLPLQVTAINSSMCAASSAPTSRWRQSKRTWWHGGPGSLNTPYPSPLPTQWVQHCFVWCWIWLSLSSTVYLCYLPQYATKRKMVKVQTKPQPRSAPATESPDS